MNEPLPAPHPLVNTLRQLVATVRETRQRVLAASAPFGSEGPDDEAIHDFRVALRRIRTVLRAVRNIWSSKRIVRLEKDFRFFARLTGKLRDDQVLRDTLTSLPLPELVTNDIGVWLERRAHWNHIEQRAILRTVREGPSRKEAWRGNKKPIRPLDEALDKLNELIDSEPTIKRVDDALAHEAIQHAIADVKAAASADIMDSEAMHELRIREKRLRYTVELFSPELSEEGRRLLSHATRMQRRLGELHDVDEAIITVSSARGFSETTQHAILDALRVARAARAAKAEPHLIEARELDAPFVLSANESLSKSST